ncbi:MAG: hypothetical protein PHY44_03825 [Lachnospiraceae bacterium]|nr:hypothetical protein [Lachnospiraceae bacterium]
MKLNKKYLKNCIIMIIAIAFIFRIGFSEQYILTVTNIWGKDILYEGKAVDEFYKQEKLKIYFYESKTKDKIGLISMRKGKF